MVNIKDFLSKKNATAIAAMGVISYTADLTSEKCICVTILGIIAILVQGIIDWKYKATGELECDK